MIHGSKTSKEELSCLQFCIYSYEILWHVIGTTLWHNTKFLNCSDKFVVRSELDSQLILPPWIKLILFNKAGPSAYNPGPFTAAHLDNITQDCSNSSAPTTEIPQSCSKPSVCQDTDTSPIFHLWPSKFLTNERRRYICNAFSHWLRTCSTTEGKQTLIWPSSDTCPIKWYINIISNEINKLTWSYMIIPHDF